MTEGEARRFLEQRAGQRMCVSYRVTSERAIRFRSVRHPLRDWVGALTASALVGCASWGGEEMLDAPEEEWVCEPGPDGESCEWVGPYPQPKVQGCEVDESSPQMSRLEPGVDRERAGPIDPVELDPPTQESAAPGELETGEAQTVRLDFEIDEHETFRGVVFVVDRGASGERLAYEPTEALVEDFRVRWKERIAQWKARRASRNGQ